MLTGCGSMKFKATDRKIKIQDYMGQWYVISGRVTFLESGAHNPIEKYTLGTDEKTVEIDFSFNKNSLDGKVKKIPQKGRILNAPTNTHWQVSPIWPIWLDYLILDISDELDIVAVGVPSGKYLWIMARDKNISQDKVNALLERLKVMGYPLNDLEIFKHNL